MEAKLTLAQAIRELREQIMQAVVEGQGSEVRFMAKSIEVELGITFEAEAKAGGGLKLMSLINLSGEAKASNENTHKVRLTLEPIGSNDKPTLVRDTKP